MAKTPRLKNETHKKKSREGHQDEVGVIATPLDSAVVIRIDCDRDAENEFTIEYKVQGDKWR